jgi:hypothetical protein
MTFKLFNALNEVFKQHKEIHLRHYPPPRKTLFKGDGLIGKYNENTDINEIELDMKTYRYATLYIVDGDSYNELKY